MIATITTGISSLYPKDESREEVTIHEMGKDQQQTTNNKQQITNNKQQSTINNQQSTMPNPKSKI